MDDTHAMKERKPESRWGVVGSGGEQRGLAQHSGSAGNSNHNHFSAPHAYVLQPRYTPPSTLTTTTTTKRVSLGLLGQTVPMRAGLRACV